MLAEYTGSRALNNYPSGSTISYYKNQLYLMGDDAASMLILDKDFNIQQEVKFFSSDTPRIKKTEKADIESSEWIIENNEGKLWLFGSGSLSPQRDKAFRYDPHTKNVKHIELGSFYRKLKSSVIPELNIEAAAKVKDVFLLGSRGNLTYPQNYIIQVSADHFPPESASRITPLNLPDAAGISGMSYLQDQDMLLITSSIEYTANAFDDGEIGGSYLGIVHDISTKLAGAEIKPDEWLDLAALHPDFTLQKIESICTYKSENPKYVTAILVSDDDMGGTRLFSLTLKVEYGLGQIS